MIAALVMDLNENHTKRIVRLKRLRRNLDFLWPSFF
jgi:hypothetical protein